MIREKPFKQIRKDDEFRTRSSIKPQRTSASALLPGEDGTKKSEKVGTCAYYKDEHEETKCVRVSNIEERKNLIIRSGRCFCCLNKGHRAFECHRKINCKICRKKRHTSLCMRSDTQANKSVAS